MAVFRLATAFPRLAIAFDELLTLVSSTADICQ